MNRLARPTGIDAIFFNNPTVAAYLESRPLLFEIALKASVILLALILLSLVYLIVHRLIYLFHKRRAIRTKAAWDPVFYSLRKHFQAPLPVINQRELGYILELWLEQRSLATNQYLAELDALAGTLQLDAMICKILTPSHSGFGGYTVWQQVIAIAAARLIHTPAIIKQLELTVESNNRYLAVEACACLAHLRAPGFERAVIKTLFRFPEEAHTITSRIGAAGGAEILHILQPFISRLPKYTIMNFIALAEQSNDPTLVPIIAERLSQSQNDEETAALLRSLGRIGTPEQIPLVLPYLNNPNLNLQIQAAKALGHIGDESTIPLLIPFLSAPTWWLRYRSAQAIVRLSRGDAEFIDTLIDKTEDRFAIDILRHVHSEQEWCLT